MTATHGEGTYGNGVGVVTPLEHKMAQVTEFVKTAANTVRAGVLWDGSATLVSGKANMSYDVRALSVILTRGSTAGAVKLTNDAVYNVTTTAAPGSNSRYDVVYIWQREYSLDGTDSNPVIGVVQGTAAASPTVPSLAAFPGALELARILVPSGVTATNSGTTITQTGVFTAAAGGVVHVRNATERDAGTWLSGQKIFQVDTSDPQTLIGSTWYSTKPTRVIPSSATNGSVSTAGVVTSTAQSLVRVRDAFPTLYYRTFRIYFDITTSAATTVVCQLAVGATDAATAYDTEFLTSVAASTGSSQLLNQTSFLVTSVNLAGRHVGEMVVSDPNQALATFITAEGVVTANPMTASGGITKSGGLHRTTTAYDSITFLAGSGTVTVNRLVVEGVN